MLAALLVPEGAAADPATRIIVKREPGLTAAERADIRADAGVRLVDTLRLPRTEVVSAPAGEAGEALRALRADEDVVYAEIDRVRRAFSDDPYFSDLWAIENTGATVAYFGTATEDADMDVLEAWDLSTGAGTTVAVVDSGVDAGHPDLAGQILAGYDWVGDDANPADENGHGTHVAGTIAAARDNQEGVAGIAPDAKVVPLRVLNAAGGGFVSDVAEAFDWAGDHGVRIVNASLGSPGFSTAERNAIAEHPQTLYVVAAGNGGDDDVGDDVDDGPVYPCAYPQVNIICVAASDPNDERAPFSNYGALSVDVFAPGVSIFSTYLAAECDDYCYSDGTSMASPHVAATAALLRARNPGLTAGAVKTAIMETADTNAFLDDQAVTEGRVNARFALDSVPADPNAPPPFIATDVDDDGVSDVPDNCDSVANPGQADADRDGVGDACDATPRGIDADGDGVGALDDRCPLQFSTLPGGCPATPPVVGDTDRDGRVNAADSCPFEAATTSNGCPLPAIAALSTKVRRCGSGRCATVRVQTSRVDTKVRVTFQRRTCLSGRCRWVRVLRRTTTVSSRKIAKVKSRRLSRGRYRAVVVVSSSAGKARPETDKFRVR